METGHSLLPEERFFGWKVGVGKGGDVIEEFVRPGSFFISSGFPSRMDSPSAWYPVW
jgi:hypothetical protein